jgi:hypothetical protein
MELSSLKQLLDFRNSAFIRSLDVIVLGVIVTLLTGQPVNQLSTQQPIFFVGHVRCVVGMRR